MYAPSQRVECTLIPGHTKIISGIPCPNGSEGMQQVGLILEANTSEYTSGQFCYKVNTFGGQLPDSVRNTISQTVAQELCSHPRPYDPRGVLIKVTFEESSGFSGLGRGKHFIQINGVTWE